MKLPTLYKKDKKGKILQWEIEFAVVGTYRTIEGYVDGKLTISESTQCIGKNVGKSNETTHFEQAKLEAKAKWDKKLKSGYVQNIADIDSHSYIEPQLAHKYEQYGEKYMMKLPKVFSQPKLDGIRCKGTRDGLFSRLGNRFISCPHIEAEVKAFLLANPDIESLDGELYNHDLKQDFNKIVSLVKQAKPDENDLIQSEKLVQYHVYDCVSKEPFVGRSLSILFNINLKSWNYLHGVDTVQILSQEHLNSVYQYYLERGYEGQMLRNGDSMYQHGRTKDLLKRKEFVDEECEIIDVLEGEGNRSKMAGTLIVKRSNDKQFRASISGGEDFYKRLLIDRESLIGKFATIKYQNLTPDGIPRFPVCIAIRDYE